ncbi:hypothetical protein BcDW1_2733 [Botrytis cinerea BcDW1]|uniref:Uncharacterized protein n=1 Tax=Botryotinia fuckeliana (strain BcDW1) TaxID=1290391 RepID=M7U4Y7_BOTF1|nr:hypothetical protein BcDW1_2733 [Botrytis cinerea BcDW1]
MPLVELNPGTSDWQDVKHATLILWRASQISDVTALQNDLRNYDTISAPTIINLHTGINRTRKAILINDQDTITIAFEGSTDDEILVNLWTDGKGPNCLGFTEIVEHVRHTYGSQCSSPQDWASDDTLGSLIQHLTFASTGAGDMGYLTLLNELYGRYQIRAWDFLNHWDRTPLAPPYHFRNWRGHRYILPQEVTCHLGAGFGPIGHLIQGYYQSAEWMANHGLDQVKTAYRSGYA